MSSFLLVFLSSLPATIHRHSGFGMLRRQNCSLNADFGFLSERTDRVSGRRSRGFRMDLVQGQVERETDWILTRRSDTKLSISCGPIVTLATTNSRNSSRFIHCESSSRDKSPLYTDPPLTFILRPG